MQCDLLLCSRSLPPLSLMGDVHSGQHANECDFHLKVVYKMSRRHELHRNANKLKSCTKLYETRRNKGKSPVYICRRKRTMRIFNLV